MTLKPQQREERASREQDWLESCVHRHESMWGTGSSQLANQRGEGECFQKMGGAGPELQINVQLYVNGDWL